MPEDKKKKLFKHRANLESGGYGRKQGKKIPLGYEVGGKKVGANYVSPEGVKAKDIEGAKPIESKYGAPKGKLGGAVSRIPRTVKPPIVPPIKKPEEKSPGTKTSKFYSTSLKKPDEKGVDVKATSSEALKNKTNEALKSTDVGKPMTDTQKEFKEAPEFQKNKETNAAYIKSISERNKAKLAGKYESGSRTEAQKKANQEARDSNKGIQEGSGKAYRKKLRIFKRDK